MTIFAEIAELGALLTAVLSIFSLLNRAQGPEMPNEVLILGRSSYSGYTPSGRVKSRLGNKSEEAKIIRNLEFAA